MENLFEKGCLVQLSASVWQARRKINMNQLSGIAAPKQWLSANKKLIDPDALKPIQKVVNMSRSYLTGVSLPFPLHGMVFMPKEMIGKVDGRLGELKCDFDRNVRVFLESYEELRTSAMVQLGDLFNEMDYPVDMSGKFSFVWRFVILDVPNGNTALLAPEVYEREKEKFVETMEQARELGIQCLREEFSQMVTRITERFTTGPDGKPKVFKTSTVDHFYAYFETFKQRNVFRDDQLAQLVDRAQGILAGRPAGAIRSDKQMKGQIREGMEHVERAMADILSMPRRKIVLN